MRRFAKPAGFTMIELLLVLVLIVAIGALASPAIGTLLDNRRVRRAGDQVRVAMSDARLDAMRSGRMQVMRVELGGAQYAVQPWYDASDATEAADMAGRSAAGGPGAVGGMAVAMPNADQREPAEAESLPRQATFAAAQVESTLRSSAIDQQAVASGGEGWSQPILFYADGTSSSAVVKVGAEEVGFVLVRLRGLTGEATASEVTP